MLYNFRFDRSEIVEITRRIKEDHLLCQGWGGGGKGGLDVRMSDFIPKCKNRYKLASTRIPSNLTWMRDFKDGDLLVVPHLPEYGYGSVHVVDGDFPGCYVYEPDDELHLNHGIRVKRSYGLDGTISIYNHRLAEWHGRLSGLRLPVIRVPDLEAVFRDLIHDIEEKPDVPVEESKLDEFLGAAVEKAVEVMRVSLSGIAAAGGTISFEAVCEHLILSWGYRIEGRHYYDGDGGDVDIRCSRQRTDISPFESGETTLLVQVKKHSGKTDEWAVKQLVAMMAKEPTADGCVMSLADGFTAEADALAQQHGIMLMDGKTICRLLLGRLTSNGSTSAA